MLHIFSIYESQHPFGNHSKKFSKWFSNYVYDPRNYVVDEGLRHLAIGPKINLKAYLIFFINGFKFNTKDYGAEKLTCNSRVFVKGSDDPDEHIKDFYNVLTQILGLTYYVEPTEMFFCSSAIGSVMFLVLESMRTKIASLLK